MILKNMTRDTVLLDEARLAATPWSRFMGLMGKASLQPGEGLVLQPGNQIHMFFMRMSIDAIFVDRDWKVLHISHGIRPWRISRLVRGSKRVIETTSGLCLQSGTEVGDQLGLD